MPDQQTRQRKKAAAKKQQNQPPAEPKTRAAKAAAANATASPRWFELNLCLANAFMHKLNHASIFNT